MVNETPNISPTARYTEAEAATLLGCDRKTLQRARDSKELRKINIAGGKSRRVYYKGQDLLMFYNRH